MAKDPAFLFYTNDFDSKTKFFTHEQVGKFMRLLMAQHQTGHLTEKQMIQVCGGRDEDVFGKFIADEKGLFFNERLQLEIEKRQKFTASRKNNLTGKSSHMDNHMKPHMGTHTGHRMDNEIEIDNDIDKEGSNKFFILKEKIEKGLSPTEYAVKHFQIFIEKHLMTFGQQKVSMDSFKDNFDKQYPVGHSFADDKHIQNAIKKSIQKLAETPEQTKRKTFAGQIIPSP